MKFVSRTHPGLVRSSNQDSLLVCLQQGLFAIADGMGGHNGGDIASALAVETVKQCLQAQKPSLIAMEQAVQQANTAIRQRQNAQPELSGMGTTFTGIWEDKESIYLAHVGDSRAYLLQDGKLVQLTQDHSVVAQFVAWGYLTEDEARTHPLRNRITRAVGTDEALEVDMMKMPKHEGDVYLLCSDGLTEYLSNSEIEAVFSEAQSSEAIADKLLQKALDGGGADNVSLIIAEVTA